MSEFHFLRPLWFLALIPALALLVLLWKRHGSAAGWREIVSPALLPHLLLEDGKTARRFPLAALGLGWLLAVTALAGPTWERQPQPVYRAPADRVIVLDMSPSMAAADLKPDRLRRARFAIRNLLAQTQEGRTGLVVFGAEPHVVTPLTDDVATIEALLSALTTDILPAPGDRGGPALRTAGELLQRVGSLQGEVLLFSDGISDPADSLNALHALRRHGVETSVVGVGTPAGAPAPTAQGGFETAEDGGLRLARLDGPALAALASAGGGRYQRLDQGPVTALLARAVHRDPTQAKTDRQGVKRWVEKGPWLLLPLVLLAAAAFRRGWLSVLVVLLVPPPQAIALGWQDLWLRPDQQAARLLEQGQAGAAAERFEDPAWRATARYRAGDYVSAAEGFSGKDADSRYNRGNALARAGRLEEALAAYDEALKQQPGHDDARFNRELIEKLLRQRKSPSQDDSTGSSQAAPSGRPDKGGSANNQQRQEGGDSQATENSGSDSVSPTPSEHPETDNRREGQPETSNAQGSQQPAGNSTAPQSGNADPISNRPDSVDQARTDVAPSAESSIPAQPDGQTRPTDSSIETSGATANHPPTAPMSEQQLALEQWLRQVPDDPAGLLRRKFMVEHLLRKKRRPGQ